MPPQGVQQIKKALGSGHVATLSRPAVRKRQQYFLSHQGLHSRIRQVYPLASEDNQRPMFTHSVTMNAPKCLDRLPVQGEVVCVEGV